MTLQSGFTFFIAIFIFGITPGPGVFALLGRSMAYSAKSCFPLALGMATIDIIYLIMACFGLATIAENWNTVFTAIRLIGAAYLIYLGWKMWHAPVEISYEATKTKQDHWLTLFTQGALISASNPKVILFYIAFLPTFMDLSILQLNDIVIASILTLFALMSGLMMIVYGAERAKQALKSTTAMQRLNRTAGAIMASAGIFLATRQ